MLKIIKIAEGVFKHVVNKGNSFIFYNTNASQIGLSGNSVYVNTGAFGQSFDLNEVLLYDVGDVDPTVVTSVEEFITILTQWGYPLLNNNVDSSTYVGIDVAGAVRDETKDIVQLFSDGTVQTIYFDAAGDWAGISKRE